MAQTDDPTRPPPASTTAQSEDERQLAELGYRQELSRAWSGFTNFAISFTIISVLAGTFTTFAFAWQNGGPVAVSSSPGTESKPVCRIPEFVPLAESPGSSCASTSVTATPRRASASATALPTTPAPTTVT